jgi:hypothetical protein
MLSVGINGKSLVLKNHLFENIPLTKLIKPDMILKFNQRYLRDG